MHSSASASTLRCSLLTGDAHQLSELLDLRRDELLLIEQVCGGEAVAFTAVLVALVVVAVKVAECLRQR